VSDIEGQPSNWAEQIWFSRSFAFFFSHSMICRYGSVRNCRTNPRDGQVLHDEQNMDLGLVLLAQRPHIGRALWERPDKSVGQRIFFIAMSLLLIAMELDFYCCPFRLQFNTNISMKAVKVMRGTILRTWSVSRQRRWRWGHRGLRRASLMAIFKTNKNREVVNHA